MAVREDLFAFLMSQQRNGAAAIEASERLTECVNRSRDTGLTSELTIKIKIKPDGAGSGQYFVEDKIEAKLPTHLKGKTIFFGTPEGNLQRNDPRQHSLPLRSVDDDTAQADLKKA